MKRTIVISLTAVAAVLAVLAFGFWRLFIGTSAEVEAVADQFQPPAEWTLEQEVMNTDREFCLEGNPCPSLARNYNIPERLPWQQFSEMVDATGWDLKIEGGCEPASNVQSPHSVCSASGQVDGFDVEIVQWASPNPDEATTIQLYVAGER